MIRAARLEQFGAPPKQRFCFLRGKATHAGQADASLQGNAASCPGGWGIAKTVPFPQGIACLHSSIGSEMPRLWAVRHPFAVLPAERRRLWHIARALCAFEKCAGAVRYLHLFVRTREAFNPAKASKVTGPSGCMVECRALPAGEQPLLWGAASAFLFRLWRRCRFRRAGPLLWKAACGSLDPCWPRQAAP